MNKKNVMIIIGIISFILIIGGVSFSYFVYNKDVGNVSLNTGEISIDFSNSNGNKALSSVIPLSDNDGKNTSDYFDFTVNATVDTEKIYYEVYILPKTGNTLDTSYLKTYLTDQSNNEINGVALYSSLQTTEKESDGKILYKGLIELNNNHTRKTESKDFRLRMWLDENYPEQTSKTFEFDIYLYAKNVEENYEIYGESMVRKAILAKINAETNSCNPIWVDDNGTASDESDDITYFSGTNDCVDMNYVWYSGKLWRITAIYPDGAMKLVTENNITTISFNAMGKAKFYTGVNTTSYMYQWLNEDFYDTLYNANNIIDTKKEWDMGTTSTINSKPSESVNISSSVGLLNSYEYYNSYRNLESYSGGYLNIGYYWWLLNPYNASDVWYVNNEGDCKNAPTPSTYAGRPSIVIKTGLEFKGDGTSDSPYRIVSDKETGISDELINTRLSGEYVKLKNGNNEQLFRIIGVEDNKTKIIAMDYAENKNTRKFATSKGSANTLWGSGTTTDTDTWYTYLNDNSTGYLKNLKDTYGELFDSGLYYLGTTSEYNYKLSVCANTTSGNTKVCNKTSNKGTFNIGLPRYGEMFAAQQAGGTSNSINIWLINRFTTSYVWDISNYGGGDSDFPTYTLGVRPTVHLKSTVKIISGRGTESDPYVVGL